MVDYRNHMRKFEARAWDEELHKMVYASDPRAFALLLLKYPDSTTQYTGFEDSLGQKVYEGDIIQDNVHREHGERYCVVYDPREGCYRAYSGTGSYWYPIGVWLSTQLSFKVIGNIYENPELLKEGYEHDMEED